MAKEWDENKKNWEAKQEAEKKQKDQEKKDKIAAETRAKHGIEEPKTEQK